MKPFLSLARVTLLSGTCFMLFIVTVWTFITEYKVAIFLNGTTRDHINSLADPGIETPEPASARSVRDFMSACGNTLVLAPQLKAEPLLAARVSARCKLVANRVLVLAPSNARALAVSLLTSGKIDHAFLSLAQAAAPFEPWPLNIRMQAVAADPSPTADVISQAGEDIRRALMSPWGAAKVANLYRLNRTLRPAITTAAARSSLDDQRQFLDFLSREMSQAD